MKKLLVIAGFAALLFATACMPIDNPEKKYGLQITAENLAGTWEGSVDRDRAQGYYQKWRFKFDGNNYTFWHTYQTSGTINDDVQGIKTVGSKEKGTWACENGNLVLTPSEIYASFAITSMNPQKYSYYEYNPETMEAVQWYQTSSEQIEKGIKEDLEDGTEWYVKKWAIVYLTQTELKLQINREAFILDKK